MTRKLIIGSRGSNLALTQSNYVADLLRQAEPGLQVDVKIFSTRGDLILDQPLAAIGGKGLFTAELEGALRDEEIDLAVHSLKDLPTDEPDGLVVAASPKRANPLDAFVSRDYKTLGDLPEGARIGTSSLRRQAQLLAVNATWEMVDVRGNVETRMNKTLVDGVVDAVILACAGLERIGREDAITEAIPPGTMLPAAAQGALGIQARADDEELNALLTGLSDPATVAEVLAERSFLEGLGGGCQVPIGALAHLDGETLVMKGCVCSLDGQKVLRAEATGAVARAQDMGKALAETLLQQGAESLIAEIAS